MQDAHHCRRNKVFGHRERSAGRLDSLRLKEPHELLDRFDDARGHHAQTLGSHGGPDEPAVLLPHVARLYRDLAGGHDIAKDACCVNGSACQLGPRTGRLGPLAGVSTARRDSGGQGAYRSNC